MKILKPLATLTLCLLSAFGTSVVLSPQQAKAEKACSNKSLDGAYGVEGGGYLNYSDLFTQTAINVFDGNGKITGTILVRSIAGDITTNLSTGGTYQVNSDCSFSASYTREDGSSANFSGFVFGDGNKFVFSETDSGSNVTARGERIRKDYPSH